MSKSNKGKYFRRNKWVDKVIGYPQSQTNRTLEVPKEAYSDYELALQSGLIPPGTTLEEWLNRPVNASMEITEYGENV